MLIVFIATNFHVISVGDGRLGYPPLAPYDAIHVGAAAPYGVPDAVRCFRLFS